MSEVMLFNGISFRVFSMPKFSFGFLNFFLSSNWPPRVIVTSVEYQSAWHPHYLNDLSHYMISGNVF